MDGKMWFGTDKRSIWLPGPQSGASVSPEGAFNSGVLSDGGGFVNTRFGNHKMYQFTWHGATDLPIAQYLRAYSSGLYGRGLLYPIDPLTYHTNILPIQWSAPGLTARGGGDYPPLLRGYGVSSTAFQEPSGVNFHGLPDVSADIKVKKIATAPAAFPNDSLFINVPEGMRLRIAAWYYNEPNLGVYWGYDNGAGGVTEANKITASASGSPVINWAIPSTAGKPVRIWIGSPTGPFYPNGLPDGSPEDGALRVRAMMARLEPADGQAWRVPQPPSASGPWVPGEGNSGCRLDVAPTITYTSAVGVGQAGVSITLRETGSWEL